MDKKQLKKAVEAIIFASDEPVSINRLEKLFPEVKKAEIENIIVGLNREYQAHAFTILKVAGGYQMVTKPEYHDWVKQLYAGRTRPRLSTAALETLSIIAYKQPVSRIEIEAIRGVNSDGVLGTLLERGLIVIKGRAETVGRPLLYGTTDEFLKYFGLNDLAELPKPSEIEAMLKKQETAETVVPEVSVSEASQLNKKNGEE